MSKGVAIPYIIALVIGIIVVVIVVYWIYRMFTAQVIDCGACKARFIQWCNLCLSANGNQDWYNDFAPMSLDLVECADKCNLHPKSEECKNHIGSYCDITSFFLCKNANIDYNKYPCITCAVDKIKKSCEIVGVK